MPPKTQGERRHLASGGFLPPFSRTERVVQFRDAKNGKGVAEKRGTAPWKEGGVSTHDGVDPPETGLWLHPPETGIWL